MQTYILHRRGSIKAKTPGQTFQGDFFTIRTAAKRKASSQCHHLQSKSQKTEVAEMVYAHYDLGRANSQLSFLQSSALLLTETK